MTSYINLIHQNHTTNILTSGWFNSSSQFSGDVYLRTPLTSNEGNMFHITIRTYEYGGSYNGVYNFGGYCYGAGGLISTHTQTLSNNGRGVDIGSNSSSKVYCKITSGAGYYNHFMFEYIGWQPKNVDDFTWSNSAG